MKFVSNNFSKPDYKTPEELAALKNEMDEINGLMEALKDVCVTNTQEKAAEKKNECPICYTDAKEKQIFTCQKCDNWICGECNEQLTQECPLCRESLRFSPFMRNKGLERFFQ